MPLRYELRSREDKGTMYEYKLIINRNVYTGHKQKGGEKKGGVGMCSLQVTQCNLLRGFNITGATPSNSRGLRRLKATDNLVLSFCSFNAT